MEGVNDCKGGSVLQESAS